MANRFALRTLCLPALLLAVSWTGEGWGQRGEATERLGSVHSGIALQVQALGDRLRTSGKEHTVLQGEFITTGSRGPAEVRHELSGKIRLEGFKPGSGVLSFDGERAYGVASPEDHALLETFGQDMAEGMFVSHLGSGAVRLLGRRFGPAPESNPDYAGPRFDVYEVTAAVPTRPESLTRRKRYYFNSDTGLLHSTRYNDQTAGSIRVHTVFSNWQVVDGSAYPGRIERYEAGTLRFMFVVAGVANGPRQAPEAFH